MIRWKRAKDDYVESYCGNWWVTPNYWGCTRPQSYTLMRKVDGHWKISDRDCATQREAKESAAYIFAKEKAR